MRRTTLVHRSVSALIRGHDLQEYGVPLAELPPSARQLVLDVRALLGLATRPGVKVDKQWLGEVAHLPALMRCLVFMAWHFQAAGVKSVTLVPLMQRPSSK
jgi:hypothetical protein